MLILLFIFLVLGFVFNIVKTELKITWGITKFFFGHSFTNHNNCYGSSGILLYRFSDNDYCRYSKLDHKFSYKLGGDIECIKERLY